MSEFAEKEHSSTHGIHQVAETAALAGEAAHHHIPTMGPVLQGAGGVAGTAVGIKEIADGHYADGGLHAAGGLVNTAQSVATLAGKTGAAHTIGKATPIIDGLSAINNFRKGEVGAGITDSVSAVLSTVSAPLGTAWKVGNMVGNGLNQRSAEDNQFGRDRNASQAAADDGRDVRAAAKTLGFNDQEAFVAGGVTTLGKAGANAIDSALNAVVVPPGFRSILQGRHGEGAGGIGGTGLSIMDVAAPGLSNLLGGGETGPSYQEAMVDPYLSKMIKLTQAPASPYGSMYNHDD
jgi:hypothetical protein